MDFYASNPMFNRIFSNLIVLRLKNYGKIASVLQ